MSTRSQIAFYEANEKDLEKFEALIYRHFDGYPTEALVEIAPIIHQFNKKREFIDIEYCSAWLVAQLKTDHLNIGICKVFHDDIEYLYAIYPGKIVVYATVGNYGENSVNINGRVTKLDEVELTDENIKNIEKIAEKIENSKSDDKE